MLQSVLVAVPARVPGDDCPSSRQVEGALALRIPDALVPGETTGPDVLRLMFGPRTGNQRMFSLIDEAGLTRLARPLAIPAEQKAADCTALAQTVVLIVERFLQELAYQGPARRPPPWPPDDVKVATTSPLAAANAARHPWELSLGTIWRPGEDGLGAHEARLSGARSFGPAGRLRAYFAGAVAGSSPYPSASMRRWPMELGLLGTVTTGRAEVEAGFFGGLDVIAVQPRSDPAARSPSSLLRPGPVAGLLVAVRFHLGEYFFLRIHNAAGIAVTRYDFVNPAGERVFGTSRTYAKIGAEGGFAF